ncbi:hypothetical protein [Sphingobium aromaticiconvertens]|uniref:hypothetical protein n=1 Tax=Sphingobium aromaticiconvertens TaxID=365341 RepID=UPI0030193998
MRVAGRFTATGGKPPAQLYRTPQAWLRIIDGFAAEQSGSRDAFVTEVLEDALYGSQETSRVSDMVWLNELHALIDAMTDRLSREVDLRSIADYVAGSGLYLENEAIVVGEWPADLMGQSENEVLHADVLGLVPHVLGLNYTPVVDVDLPVSDETRELVSDTSDILPDAVDRAASIALKAGTRIGAALAVHAETKQPTFALIECQVAHLSLKDETGRIFVTRETSVDLEPFLTTKHEWSFGTPDSSEVGSLPSNWLPNSVRFQFPGSTGFERLARSLVVKPWIWTDFEEIYVWRGDSDEADDYPVTSPIHTVAAAIESNLLYADIPELGGGAEARLDWRLLTEMRRVEAIVTRFRLSHETRRRSRRDALMTEWGAEGESDT